MQLRGVTSDNSLKFQPGGRLSAQLAWVSSLLLNSNGIPLVRIHMHMTDAWIAVNSKGFRIAANAHEGELSNGLVTHRKFAVLHAEANRKERS